jgi:hypothetical protein
MLAMRTEKEIEDFFDNYDERRKDYPDLWYELGVNDALLWVLGEADLILPQKSNSSEAPPSQSDHS